MSGIAGVLHYYFFVKSDIRDPLAYAALLAVLLAFRGWQAMREKRLRPSPSRGQTAKAAG
jgi:sulfoxide reductase heme-binding subunit YedZ